MQNASIPYLIAVTAATIEVAKASIKKKSVMFLVLAVAGFFASLAGGIVTGILLEGEKWIIGVISTVFILFCLLNLKTLFFITRDWFRRYQVRTQVPDTDMDYNECIKTDSLVTFRNLIRKEFLEASLWDDLLRNASGV
jgi:hypothetical protein